jgi:uncharacterized membrane protein
MRPFRSRHNLLILFGYALGVALYPGLPEQGPPSWSAPDRGAVWFGGPMVAFSLPTVIAVTDTLLRGLCVRHPLDEAGPGTVLATYDAIMLRVIAFVIGLHATMLAGVLGMLEGHVWAARIVPVMLGATMIGVGNLLPQTRPNLAIGIRTPHTLSDRLLWIRTHRIAGYLTVALGFVIVLAAVALPPPIGPGMILLVGPVGVLGLCYATRYCRRQSSATHNVPF